MKSPAIVLFFPVQPHIYKFLQQKCGEKLSVNHQSLYGSVVLDILQKRGATLHGNPGELTYPVEISLRYMREFGIYVDDSIIKKFNHRVDKMFKEELRTHVKISNGHYSVAKDAAIRSFMAGFNITEDDIKFETLKKDIGRNVRDK